MLRPICRARLRRLGCIKVNLNFIVGASELGNHLYRVKGLRIVRSTASLPKPGRLFVGGRLPRNWINGLLLGHHGTCARPEGVYALPGNRVHEQSE